MTCVVALGSWTGGKHGPVGRARIRAGRRRCGAAEEESSATSLTASRRPRASLEHSPRRRSANRQGARLQSQAGTPSLAALEVLAMEGAVRDTASVVEAARQGGRDRGMMRWSRPKRSRRLRGPVEEQRRRCGGLHVDRSERRGELTGSRKALGWLFAETAHHDGIERSGQVWP